MSAGLPQVTRVRGAETDHANRSVDAAMLAARTGRFSEIYFNRALSTCSGGCIQSRLRPDVVGVRRDDRSLDLWEALSGRQRLSDRQYELSPFVSPSRVQEAE